MRPPPSRNGVANAVIARLKTSRVPVRSPGSVIGTTTRQKTVVGVAPRLWAASPEVGVDALDDGQQRQDHVGQQQMGLADDDADLVLDQGERLIGEPRSRPAPGLTRPVRPRMTVQPNARTTAEIRNGKMTRASRNGRQRGPVLEMNRATG